MNKIVIYTQDTCIHCKRALEFLKTHGLPYEERNVSVDQKAYDELMSNTIKVTPTFVINGEHFHGWEPRDFEGFPDNNSRPSNAALDNRKYEAKVIPSTPPKQKPQKPQPTPEEQRVATPSTPQRKMISW